MSNGTISMTKCLVEDWPTISIVDFDPIQLDLTEFKSNLFSYYIHLIQPRGPKHLKLAYKKKTIIIRHLI